MIPWLDPEELGFPHPSKALEEPPGLLAAGGDLSPQRLLKAYSMGIFPWYEDQQPILWWSPNPRAVLFPAEFRLRRSLLLRLLLGLAALATPTDHACSGAPGSAFTGIIIGHFTN